MTQTAHEKAAILRRVLDLKNALKRDIHAVQKGLAQLGTEYHDGLPLGRLEALLEAHDFHLPPDESNGIYCGDDGRCVFTIYHGHTATTDIDQGFQRRHLSFSWHRMPSGRFEITAYLA